MEGIGAFVLSTLGLFVSFALWLGLRPADWNEPNLIYDPIFLIVEAIILYIFIRSGINVFWLIIPYTPVVIIFLAQVIFTITSDPIANFIAITTVGAILIMIEIKHNLVWVLLVNIHHWKDLRASEQERRVIYNRLKRAAKDGSLFRGDFEAEAKKVVK